MQFLMAITHLLRLNIALDFLSENPSLPAGLLDKIEQAIDPLQKKRCDIDE